MILLDGNSVSKQRLEKLKEDVDRLSPSNRPGLAVIRVGEDPASKIYVGKKMKKCQEMGFTSREIHFSDSVGEQDLLQKIEKLNHDRDIHGILVQLPLPRSLSTDKVLDQISPQKDVDGFHPENLGRLALNRNDGFVACTPLGIMNLLKHYRIPLAGKRAVVIGRSRTVGRPMSLLLDQAGATVTAIHLQTENPEAICREADLVVAAAGRRHLVGASHLREGAVVVDVGIHRDGDGRITGDVDFEAVKSKVKAITPVPGGVGPMTICALLENTFRSFRQLSKIS